MTNIRKYSLGVGTVQCYVSGGPSAFFYAFGLAEYDRNRAILSPYREERAQPIVDGLNNGTISENEARKRLKEIW